MSAIAVVHVTSGDAALLLIILFCLAAIWAAGSPLDDPHLSLSRKRSETSPPASVFAARGKKAEAGGKIENKEGR